MSKGLHTRVACCQGDVVESREGSRHHILPRLAYQGREHDLSGENAILRLWRKQNGLKRPHIPIKEILCPLLCCAHNTQLQ